MNACFAVLIAPCLARALTAAGATTDAAIPVAASSGAFTLTLGTPAATMVLIESGR